MRGAGARGGLAVVALTLLGACAEAIPHTPPPPAIYDKAEPLSIPALRIWGDELSPRSAPDLRQSVDDLIRRNPGATRDGPPVEINYLALSGGASDGAFGAGFLAGWSETGARPMFDVVTGVSTGALLAPFAYLGPEWDGEMKRLYTSISTADIFEATIFTALRGGPAIGANRPLRRLIDQTVDDEMLALIAAEHAKGRALFVGTTAIDSARPATWNLGAIAAVGTPEAKALFKDVLLASTAIPGVFPPVAIEVEIEGRTYTELHADGGVTAQVFAYPVPLNILDFDRQLPFRTDRSIYLIRNTKARLDYFDGAPEVLPLARRALSILINAEEQGDIFRIAANAERDDTDFNIVYVPQNWDGEAKELFDQTYMRNLVAVGEAMGREPASWLKTPRAARFVGANAPSLLTPRPRPAAPDRPPALAHSGI